MEFNPIIDEQTILVVDDSNITRNLIEHVYKDKYKVMMASDGKQAMDIVDVMPEGTIMAILLDLNMPNVDGFEVLDYFKNANLFNRIPVAIITGEGTDENVKRAYTYPIVDMLQKPFNEVNIKTIVNKLIMIHDMNKGA